MKRDLAYFLDAFELRVRRDAVRDHTAEIVQGDLTWVQAREAIINYYEYKMNGGTE